MTVFELIDQGIPLHKIAMSASIHPNIVFAIALDYTELSSAVLVPHTMVSEMNKLDLEGTFPIKKAEDIMALLHSAVKESKCPFCKSGHRTKACRSCVEHQVTSALKKREAREAKSKMNEPDDSFQVSDDESDSK